MKKLTISLFSLMLLIGCNPAGLAAHAPCSSFHFTSILNTYTAPSLSAAITTMKQPVKEPVKAAAAVLKPKRSLLVTCALLAAGMLVGAVATILLLYAYFMRYLPFVIQ